MSFLDGTISWGRRLLIAGLVLLGFFFAMLLSGSVLLGLGVSNEQVQLTTIGLSFVIVGGIFTLGLGLVYIVLGCACSKVLQR